MFRTHNFFGGDTSSYAESIKSVEDYSTTDDVSSQVSSLSRPSGKAIYLQRKDYAMSINTMMDKFQYRVEHLFTCKLDGKQLKSIIDCVERLKLLDQLGRVWGQDMLLEVRGANLLLTDIETKEELESVSLSDIQGLKAVLNTGVFNSLLTLTVQPRRKHTTMVFMFQCDDVRADYIERDLSRALSRKKDEAGVRTSGAGPAGPGVELDPQWAPADYEDQFDPELVLPLEEDGLSPHLSSMESPRPYSETDRNVDILNHILNDLEIFMGKVAAVKAKNTKKKKKKKETEAMPARQEFEECLQKIKHGFNLLVALKGQISNPGVPDFVHSLFSTLAFVVSHCPEDLPPTIVTPLLTLQTIRLMSDEASTEEDQLWRSLGDAWNIPSAQWPEDVENIPTDNLRFLDGWQPRGGNGASHPSQTTSHQWKSQRSNRRPPPAGSSQPPRRVKWDFMSRNDQELSVTKGEMVEVVDMSKQWWKVRNNRGEEGFVPNNILEDPDELSDEDFGASPVLTKQSRPAEVKAWLVEKGFTKITIRCLGILSGSALLGMSREELKMVCPEEGGRVFFQLQAVKSTLALKASYSDEET